MIWIAVFCNAICAPSYATDVAQSRPTELRHARFSLPPWSTKSERHYVGAHISIFEAISKQLNAKLMYIECSLERCDEQLLSGQADIVIGLKVTPRREQFIHYLDPPSLKKTYAKVFWQRKDDYRLIEKYGDLYGFTIGIKTGAKLFLPFDDDKNLRKDTTDSLEQSFKKLARGRIDLVSCPEGLGEYMLTQRELRTQLKKSVYRVEDLTPRRIGIAQASPWAGYKHDFEAIVTEFTQTGAIRKTIEEQYFERFNVPKEAVTLAW